MSDPITFPITVYYIYNDAPHQCTFSENEAKFATFTLKGSELKIERAGIFGDYGNEPECFSTDLESVKAEFIAKIRKEFMIKMMEASRKIKLVEDYKCKNS